jgi:hypothetical protein
MKNSSYSALLIAIMCALAARVVIAQSAATPCSVLTQAQVAAALGASADSGQPIGTTGCTWSASKITATVSFWDGSKWDTMKAPLPGITKVSIAGFGEDAFVATVGPSSKQFASLNVKKGRNAVIFKIYGVASTADQISMEKALATSALSKM